jgi:predicted Zn-ribbon and HTH transcriptional regulator
MSFVQRKVAHCDQCGHEWILTTDREPVHCAKCKSRRWNQLSSLQELSNPGQLS